MESPINRSTLTAKSVNKKINKNHSTDGQADILSKCSRMELITPLHKPPAYSPSKCVCKTPGDFIHFLLLYLIKIHGACRDV